MRRALVPALLPVLVAPALLVAACSSSGSSGSTTTSPATTSTSAAPTTTPPTIASGPTTTVAATAAARATVVAYLKTFQLAVTDAEAGCLASRLDGTTLGSLDDAATNGSEATDTAATVLYAALVVCEPGGFVQNQAVLLKQGAPTATQEQVVCVVHRLNSALAADPDLLALASSEQSSSEWPVAQQARARAAIASCAPTAVIDQIMGVI